MSLYVIDIESPDGLHRGMLASVTHPETGASLAVPDARSARKFSVASDAAGHAEAVQGQWPGCKLTPRKITDADHYEDTDGRREQPR